MDARRHGRVMMTRARQPAGRQPSLGCVRVPAHDRTIPRGPPTSSQPRLARPPARLPAYAFLSNTCDSLRDMCATHLSTPSLKHLPRHAISPPSPTPPLNCASQHLHFLRLACSCVTRRRWRKGSSTSSRYEVLGGTDLAKERLIPNNWEG